MTTFLYFVDGHDTPVTPELLESWGLAYAFEKVPHHQVVSGPSDATGTLLCDETMLGDYVPAYRPEEQTWRKIPAADCPAVYVGYYTAARPTRDDLTKENLLPGYAVPLADGLEWQVPLVRQVSDAGESECTLPAYLDVDDKGETIRGEVVEQYRWLLEKATPFWEAFILAMSEAQVRLSELSEQATEAEKEEASQFSIDCPTLRDDAIAVLGANYRVGLAEVMLLQLFRTDKGFGELMKAACDTDYASLLLQKKTPE